MHLLVELYARSLEEATEVLESAARGLLTITSLAEESRRRTGDRTRREQRNRRTTATIQRARTVII